MNKEKGLYWIAQSLGWLVFTLLIFFQNIFYGQADKGIALFLLVNFVVGILLSHCMRALILRFGLLRMKLIPALWRVVVLSMASGVAASLVLAVIFGNPQRGTAAFGLLDARNLLFVLELFLPYAMIFLIWSVLYLSANFLKNYEKEEVKNLRLEAALHQVELSNLRAQLNPHFLFNALNSIRALIDENPSQSKKAITQMSHILRHGLTSDKKQLVSLAEELKVVQDYLELEKIRFEERLHFSLSLPMHLRSAQVPPLLLQTLVENAVKHGISRLPEGGHIALSVDQQDDFLIISLSNDGTFESTPAPDYPVSDRNQSAGVGIDNSLRRLKLLYGEAASLAIGNSEGRVHCSIRLPLHLTYKPTHENADRR